MATEYTPQEIAELNAQAAEEIKRLGYVSAETKIALADAATGVKGFTASINKLGSSTLGLGKSLASGQSSSDAFNKSLIGSADALSNLVGLIPGVGIAVKLATKVILQGGARYVAAVKEQSDQLLKGYKDIAAAGAQTSAGMSGVYDNLKRMNYNVATEMGDFTALVAENSQTLAMFGKTVGGGLTEVAKISQVLTNGDIGAEFAAMGLSINEINKGIVSYTKMQMLTGSRLKMSAEEQTAAAAAYIKEVDLLAKVTGRNRQQQESDKESAQTEERFAAYTAKLVDRIAAGGPDADVAKKQLEQANLIQSYSANLDPAIRKGMLNSVTGTFNSPEVQKLMRAAPEAQRMLASGMFDASEVFSTMVQGFEKDRKSAIGRASIGVQDQYSISLKAMNQAIAMQKAGPLGEKVDAGKTAQAVDDNITKNRVKQEQNDRQITARQQDALQAGMGGVTAGMRGLTGAADSATAALEGLAGVLGVKNNRGAPVGSAPAPAPASAAPSTPAAAPPSAAPSTPAAAPAAAPPSAVRPSAAPAAARPSAAAAPAAPGAVTGTDGQGAEKTGSNAAPPPAKLKTASKSGGMSEDEIKKMIIAHEGIRNKPYKDSLGLWTVGVGHLIGDGKSLPPEWNREFSQEEIMKMFEDDYAHHRLAAQKIPGFGKLGTSGQGALTDLTFNMGPSWIQKWPKLKEQLANLDLAGAAANLEGSKWFGQVKSRGPTIVGLLKDSAVMAEKGGVFSGPNSGYPATLHGDEAVIPLNNGGGNFVQMFEDMANSNRAMVGMMQEMVRAQRSSVDVQTKILKYAQ